MLKKRLVTFLKFAASAAIFAWLFYQAARNDSFATLRDQPKQWGLLAVAMLAGLAAVVNTFLRWRLLVRSLDIAFSHAEAFRLGFLGYLFNFFTVGVVGGDVIKSVAIARRRPDRKTHAVASVVVDRLLGLYAMFLLAGGAYLALDINALAVAEEQWRWAVHTVGVSACLFSALGTLGLGLLLLPGFSTWAVWEGLAEAPRVGPVFERIFTAVRMYRSRPGVLATAIGMSFLTHGLNTVGIYLCARGLYGVYPSLERHFLIAPMAMFAGALPLPGGLGGFEAALHGLYAAMLPAGAPAGQGFVVALAYRLVTILVALLGMLYYLAERRAVSELVEQAEAEAEAPARAP